MIDLFLSELHAAVKKYPKLLAHLLIALAVVIWLGRHGAYIPKSILSVFSINSTIQITLFISIMLTLLFAIIYIALTAWLADIFRRAIHNTVYEFSKGEITSTINHMKTRCFASDLLYNNSNIKAKLKIIGFSIIFIASYYLMLIHLVYSLDSIYGILATNSFVGALSSELVYPYSLLTLLVGVLFITYYVKVSELELNGAKRIQEEPHAKWVEYLVQKYTLDNCIVPIKKKNERAYY